MKNTVKYLVSFLMILILLVSTLQFSLYKMECLMSGNVQINLSDFDDCNNSQKDNNTVSQKCCDFDQVTFNFDYDTKIDIREVTFFSTSMLILEMNSTLFKSVFTQSDFSFYTNLPPPSGYELLKVVQVFRL